MLQQSAKTVMMVRPIQFAFNNETAGNNAFQNNINSLDAAEINMQATAEFDAFKNLLETNGVHVLQIQDGVMPVTPDSIFPNNWISVDQHKRMVIYPMYALNRRLEKKESIINLLVEKYTIETQYDYSDYEAKNIFLEGTGSMVIDYVNNIAYACLSPRTDEGLFLKYCADMGYKPCCFRAIDAKGMDIYHTNVMMCIGSKVAVVCLDSVTNACEKKDLISNLEKTNHTIIAISFKQMNNFAGNMLEVQNQAATKFLVMSARAKLSLTASQIDTIENFNTILAPDIPTIETVGGGGVRCMLAEIFN